MKSHYYNDKKLRKIILMEYDDWEMTVSENHELKVIIDE